MESESDSNFESSKTLMDLTDEWEEEIILMEGSLTNEKQSLLSPLPPVSLNWDINDKSLFSPRKDDQDFSFSGLKFSLYLHLTHELSNNFFINHQYIDPHADIDPKELHTIMAFIVKQLRRNDSERPLSILGPNKSRPSLVIRALIYLMRPMKFRNSDFPPFQNPVFKKLKEVDRFIHRYKYFIMQFYYYTCVGIIMDGPRLFEHQVVELTDSELDKAFEHRNLMNKWRKCIIFA